MRALAKLTAYLMKTYHVSPDRIIGHGDAKATQCPGRNMSVAAVRRMATQVLADSGETVEESVQTASGELLGDLDSSR
jgi:N-acetyl-anhydromuramyl-L-alanine amidase AmpD